MFGKIGERRNLVIPNQLTDTIFCRGGTFMLDKLKNSEMNNVSGGFTVECDHDENGKVISYTVTAENMDDVGKVAEYWNDQWEKMSSAEKENSGYENAFDFRMTKKVGKITFNTKEELNDFLSTYGH